jgi:hypothetical protein
MLPWQQTVDVAVEQQAVDATLGEMPPYNPQGDAPPGKADKGDG